MDELLYVWRYFNEVTMRSAVIVLDIAVRLPRALYAGFRAVVVGLGAPLPVASVISGLIVGGLLLALLWFTAFVVRRVRIKNPSAAALWAGRVIFWLGVAVGIYFVGLALYITGLPNAPSEAVNVSVAAAILYPLVGRGIRYVLGR